MIAFAHLSDLHFGATLANQGRGLVWGQRPHDAVKCLALPAALRSACELMDTPQEGPELPVLVTGDLTVSGAGPELAVAQAFLRGRFPIARHDGSPWQMGLGRRTEGLLATVPGNHDHWDGHRASMPPHTATIYPDHFEPTPWLRSLHDDDSPLVLELAGLDSNSGWAQGEASEVERRARGAFAQGRIANKQLDAITRHWGAAVPAAQTGPLRVRAVLCHHSPSYRSRLLGREELDARSRNRLLALCGRWGVSALLTGHTHDAHNQALATRDAQGQPAECQELRAANAVGFGKQPKDEEAEEVGFLTHRLQLQSDGQVQWDVWRWGWKNKRYEPSSRAPWHRFQARRLG